MAQKQAFSFADLPPEPLEFSGSDGRTYTARRHDDLGTLEVSELRHIQRRLQVATVQMDRGPDPVRR